MIKFHEKCLSVSEELKSKIVTLLPEEFLTLILSVNEVSRNGVYCSLRLSIKTKEEALNWMQQFQEKSLTTYNVDSTFPENTQKIVFKKKYRCHHNTRATYSKSQQPHPKHTDCTAKICITVKQHMKRSKDEYLKQYPSEVDLRFTHNHPIDSADALRHRHPTTEVENIFSEYFSNGHSPSSALEIHKTNLQTKYGEEYYSVTADGAKCPTRKWCFDLYYKIFKKQYGEPSGEQMLVALKNAVHKYNTYHNQECAALKEDSESVILAVCSPLMKRVYHLKASQEVIFIDSSGNMDRHNSRVFLFLCSSPAGALPLGIVITFSEAENIITEGIQMLIQLNGIENFSPHIIMTDDSTAERNSLRIVFPQSHLLLCKFHVLQSVWRYLRDSKHKIHSDDRGHLYRFFKTSLDSKTKDSFDENFQEMLSSAVTKKYKGYMQYLLQFKERASEWAMYARDNLLTRNNNTNNYSEASIRILKDKILKRTKAFSVVQLFDFLTKNYECYYERKLIDIINNRSEGITKMKHFVKEIKIQGMICTKLNDNEYEVASNNNTYDVNYALGICTCPVGKHGAPCKHQYAVVRNFNLSSDQFLPLMDSKFKELVYFIATGKQLANKHWCDNLKGVNTQTLNLPGPSNTKSIPDIVIGETTSSEDLDIELENNLKECFTYLENKLLNNREVFQAPLRYFVDALNTIKTESGLVSAFHTFGKYSGAGMPLLKKGKNLQGGKTIGVQPTAIARRKVYLGGRNSQNTGRPPKRSRQEHSYPKRGKENSLEPPLFKRRKAPHSLEYCVTENIALGKTH